MMKINPLSHKKPWGYFKCTMIGERSQTKKATYCMMSVICLAGKGKKKKTIEIVKRLVVARDLGLW